MHTLSRFYSTSWTGSADLFIQKIDYTVNAIPIAFQPESLSFDVSLDSKGELAAFIDGYDRCLDSCITLRNVQISNGEWTLALDQVDTYRSSAWDDWWFAEEAFAQTPLALSVSGAQRISFQIVQGNAQPTCQHWLGNWNPPFLCPAEVRLENQSLSLYASRSEQLACIHSHAFTVNDREAITLALELAVGGHLPPLLLLDKTTCTVYKKSKPIRPAQLPMFTNYVSPNRLAQFLELAVQGMADKSGFLRNAMHMTRESKNSDLPLETRYVLMMMALERLDGKRQLEEGATARLLGVSDSVAAFINDLRNKLIHGQNGGGYEGAFLAVIEERFNGEIPDWPAPWSRCLLKSQGFDFMRFYFQVLERLDAYWCRHFGFEPEDKARFHIPTQSVVLPLPETYIPLEGDSRKCSDFQKQIDELVAACDKRDRKISEKNLQIKKQGERIQSLKAQLADKDKQIAEFQVQVTMIKSGEA